jgi:FHA domain-containing protein
MTLTLRAVSLNQASLTRPITAHFDGAGGTIGRSDQNTMALPDPERIISRQHAQISACDRGYVITNIGTANPIVVRQQLLGCGESAPLRHGDSVLIGGYLLEVLDNAAGRRDETPTRRAAPAVPVPRPAPALDGLHPLAPDNPFLALLAPAPAPAAQRAAEESMCPVLPSDFDPFKPRPAAAPPRATVPSFEGLVPGAQDACIDDLIAPSIGDGRDPLDDFLSDVPVPPGRPPEPAPAPTRSDRVPELASAFAPPRALPAAAAAAPPAPAPAPEPAAPQAAPPTVAPDAQALWAAFCRGAGIQLDLHRDMTPEVMQTAGALLSLAVKGTLQLMALRSTTRYELHAPMTMIRPTRNNPLKFSPDARSALEKLLQPPAHGFVPGTVAMSDAMNDLLGHAIGTMAGTRAALEGVLGRFAPAELEGKLSGQGMLDRLLPMARKARLWELYLQHHGAIHEEAQEDFHTLFGKAFLAAYEQQLDRLQRERTAAAG